MSTHAPFGWLTDKPHRRSALLLVQRAVRNGRLDEAPAEHRAALVESLGKLLDCPDLSNREAIRVMLVLLAMDRADRTPPKPPRG